MITLIEQRQYKRRINDLKARKIYFQNRINDLDKTINQINKEYKELIEEKK